MPITPYLHGRYVDAETKRVMGVALEMARSAVPVPDRSDAITGMIAEKIIALAQAGERNPDLLCENALKDLQAVTGADIRAAASSKPESG
jgi:hypothetical protein